VSKKTSFDEKEGLQELIATAVDWLESHIAHLENQIA
jgi:hypothetical protein